MSRLSRTQYSVLSCFNETLIHEKIAKHDGLEVLTSPKVHSNYISSHLLNTHKLWYECLYSYSAVRFIFVTSSDVLRLFQIVLQRLALHNFRDISWFTMWLAPWAGNRNQILHWDWQTERARCSYLARPGLPKSRIISPLLTKFFGPRQDISLVLFSRVYGPRLHLAP